MSAQDANSYKETKELFSGEYISICLSNQYLEKPWPIRCMGCGFTVHSVNNPPKVILMGMIEAKDAGKSTDHRCKKCKITYRIY